MAETRTKADESISPGTASADRRRNPRSRWLWVGGCCAVVLALCHVAQIRLGNRAALAMSGAGPSGRPERIVSLAPSITETLFALGLGDSVVGVTRFCRHPAEACTRTDVGGYFDPSYEALIALRPDLVVLLPEHEKPREYLTSRGIAVLTVSSPTVAGILDSIRSIAAAGGVPEQADALIQEFEARMAAVAVRMSGRRPVKTMIAVGRDLDANTIGSVYIAGNAGWYSEMIKMAGGINAFQGDLAFPAVSAEGILKMNPDVIIEMLGNMGGDEFDTDQAVAAWRTLPQVTAVRDGRVHLLRDDFVVIPGPRFILILEQLARILHPEVAWDAHPPAVRAATRKTVPAAARAGEEQP